MSVDPDVGETGQPYAFTGDDPLNATDPLGLTAGPMKSPAWVCAHEHGVKNCLHKAKKAQSCGRLGCWDAKHAHAALPEAVGVVLLVGTGGLGDLAEALGGAGDAATSGDLTATESSQIQNVVNQANRPLDVVGSAARGERVLGSDIDYTVAPANVPYFDDFPDDLPGLDSHGLLQGSPDGPSIRFEPEDPQFP